MKKFYAWLLLTVSTCQWIGGHICFEVSFFIEIEHRMDEEERAIAEAVKEETGVEAAVHILDEEQLAPRGHIYSDFFAFSKEIEGRTIYFSVEDYSSVVAYEEVTTHQQPRQQDEEKMTLLKSLFQDFTIPETGLPAARTGEYFPASFQSPGFHRQFFISNFTPPPDLA